MLFSTLSSSECSINAGTQRFKSEDNDLFMAIRGDVGIKGQWALRINLD